MYRLGMMEATRLKHWSSRVAFYRERNTVSTRKHRRTAVPTVQQQRFEEFVEGSVR